MSRERFREWGIKAQRYAVECFTIGSNAASIAALFIALNFFNHADVLAYYLVFVSVMLAGAFVAREYQYARKATYAEVLAHLHRTVHDIRDRIDNVEHFSQEDFARDCIVPILDRLAEAFSIVTRTNCRTCIKVLVVHPKAPAFDSLDPSERVRNLLVRTLVRDSINTADERPARADFLNDNSDLCEVFSDPNKRFFCGDNLPRLYKKGGYQNSHLPMQPFEEWPLPYRSAMVWPIRKAGRESLIHDRDDMLGFLCVDSPATRVFVPQYDFHIGALIADALYLFMSANAGSQGPRENADGK